MIFRDGNRIIIELPDESKAEALLWLLTNHPFSEATSPVSSQPLKSARLTDAKLSGLERVTTETRSQRESIANAVERNRGPIFPWKERSDR
jgi:hypothetical protein